MTITINKKTNKQKTSAPMGAWKCNIPTFEEIMTDRTTKQPTDRRTDRVIGKLHFQYSIVTMIENNNVILRSMFNVLRFGTVTDANKVSRLYKKCSNDGELTIFLPRRELKMDGNTGTWAVSSDVSHG